MTKYPMHSEALTTNSQPKRRTLGPHSSLGILDFFGYLGISSFRLFRLGYFVIRHSLGAWVFGYLGVSSFFRYFVIA